jgi:hypothetical protein
MMSATLAKIRTLMLPVTQRSRAIAHLITEANGYSFEAGFGAESVL